LDRIGAVFRLLLLLLLLLAATNADAKGMETPIAVTRISVINTGSSKPDCNFMMER